MTRVRKLHRPDAPPLSPIAIRVANLLRDFEDGLTLQELEAEIGSRYINRVISGMQRAGYAIGEDGGRLVLVVEPKIEAERTVGNSPEPPGQPSRDGGAATLVASAKDALSRKAPGLDGDAGLLTRAANE